ncbi:hypothetical protein Mgra_00002070 [Meloidogyne graminicola]|uniref:Uncharacterized protein n=1 Tax=Meloidogyne graminicola TaxID=189291 RepID=A0A8S9ZYQ3_9BILA|nr:hypothetical protein Mgra_00002070 [Meloidogyne graminicola]
MKYLEEFMLMFIL